MKVLSKGLFLLGYILLVGPPRALDLQSKERETGGELADQPLALVLVVELMLRSAFLLLVAVLAEELMGKFYYDHYKLDLMMAILIASGLVHAVFYFIFIGLLYPRSSKTALRLYRFGRNMAYAALPGLVTVIPPLIWQTKNQIPPFSGDLIDVVYFGTFAVMALAGIIEALILNRHPLGLDESLRKSKQEPYTLSSTVK